MEDAKASLSAKGLMAVAEGEMPASALCIIDVSLDDLPKLPASHRDAARREEKRISVKAQNQANALKREQLTLEAWTQLYGALKACTAAKAPVLSRTMADRCDLATRGVKGGYFDGPLAWRLAKAALAKAQRTDADKAYYRKAERLQTEHRLPDGCLADAYVKKALAFVLHINPNLAQPYTASDASQYLLDLCLLYTSPSPRDATLSRMPSSA